MVFSIKVLDSIRFSKTPTLLNIPIFHCLKKLTSRVTWHLFYLSFFPKWHPLNVCLLSLFLPQCAFSLLFAQLRGRVISKLTLTFTTQTVYFFFLSQWSFFEKYILRSMWKWQTSLQLISYSMKFHKYFGSFFFSILLFRWFGLCTVVISIKFKSNSLK